MRIINNNGFTLIELSVVLFIIGLLLSGLLTPLTTSVEQERRENLEEQYSEVDDALSGFAIVNGRLPCPDCPLGAAAAACTAGGNVINDGIEDQSGAVCAVGAAVTVDGNLPWVTLGVTGTDPWGNTLGYHVEVAYADTTAEAVCTPASANASFSICTTASITIQDKGDIDVGCTAAPIPNNVATNVPVVVYSQGNAVATSCDELENTDGDSTFVDTDFNQVAATFYDDMIFWISPFVLDNKMVKAEVLP
jgi:prepilin-type N-terminal cleavage/methylation domain-containing protein